MTNFVELKLLLNDDVSNVQQVNYDKHEVYNTLLQMNHAIREECINNINAEYGYKLVDKYDFARYEISINNSNEEAESITLFTPTYTNDEVNNYKDQMKELQKGYMKMLANQNRQWRD